MAKWLGFIEFLFIGLILILGLRWYLKSGEIEPVTVILFVGLVTLDLLRRKIKPRNPEPTESCEEGVSANELARDPVTRRNTVPLQTEPFVGREDDLDQLLKALERDQAEIITGQLYQITGAGGIGKTMLAREVARRCGHRFPDGVFEFLAAEHSPQSLVMELARHLGQEPDEPADARAAHELLNALLQDRKVLLVLDNLNRREDAPYLIPRASQSRVIITTRDVDCEAYLKLKREDLSLHRHHLETFTEAETLALFRRLLGDGFRPEDETRYLAVATMLGFLPLALRQAINLVLFSPHWSIATLEAKLSSGRSLALLDEGQKREGGDLRTLEAVYVLAEEWFPSENAKRTMGYLSVAAEGPVPLAFLQSWCDIAELELQLEKLTARAWLIRHEDGAGRSYEQHVLVRQLFREQVADPEMSERFLAEVHRIYKDDEVGFREKEQWLPQFKQALRVFVDHRDRRLVDWLYANFHDFCERRGQGNLFVDLAEKARLCFEKDEEVLATSMAHQALILKAWGRLEEAYALHQKEQKIKEALGDRAGLAKCYGNQALILSAWGRKEEAYALHQKEQEIKEALGDRAGLATCYGNQALILSDWGKMEEAYALHQKQQEISEALGDRAGLAKSYAGQALILGDWGKMEEAYALHQKEQEIYEALGDRPGLAITFWNLGTLREKMGHPEEKTDLWQRSIALNKEMGIPTSDDEKALAGWVASQDGKKDP